MPVQNIQASNPAFIPNAAGSESVPAITVTWPGQPGRKATLGSPECGRIMKSTTQAEPVSAQASPERRASSDRAFKAKPTLASGMLSSIKHILPARKVDEMASDLAYTKLLHGWCAARDLRNEIEHGVKEPGDLEKTAKLRAFSSHYELLDPKNDPYENRDTLSHMLETFTRIKDYFDSEESLRGVDHPYTTRRKRNQALKACIEARRLTQNRLQKVVGEKDRNEFAKGMKLLKSFEYIDASSGPAAVSGQQDDFEARKRHVVDALTNYMNVVERLLPAGTI